MYVDDISTLRFYGLQTNIYTIFGNDIYNFVYNIKAGNRLELQLVNARPFCVENPLTGEPIQAQTHWSTAQVSLYLNSQYPSRIVLPAVIHEKKGTIRRLP